MIVRMKKLTVLCLDRHREATLDALRDLGVLHLVPLAKPESADLDELRRSLESAQAALQALSRVPPATPAPAASRDDQPVSWLEHVHAVHERLTEKRRLGERLDAVRAEETAVEPFGDFDPHLVRQLHASGIAVRLYVWPSRTPPSHPGSGHLFVLRRTASGHALAWVGRPSDPPPSFSAREVPLPARRLSDMRRESQAIREHIAALDADLASLARYTKHIRDGIQALRERIAFLEAREGMGTAEGIAYVQGFCPHDCVRDVQNAATQHGWGLVIADPNPADRVPTLIRNPSWIRPIEPVFKTINILPGYHEADVSAAFLIFLSLFFAMIIGDAGYGLMFLLITAWARWKARKAPKEPFRLLTLFSMCTIVWGALCGVYFGVVDLPAPLRRIRIDWLTDNRNVMHLCLWISALHLSLAHGWNGLRLINSWQAVAQAGWIAITWSMFFLARQLIVGIPPPPWFGPLALSGVIAVVLFMTPRQRLATDWVNHLMLPLSFMSSFGDILSYLRLFALSIASLKLAGAFNSMALSLGFSHPIAGLVAALILFVGHALNITLGAVSVLVHGIRLNALEFSMHFGLEWTGFPYTPFAKRSNT